MFDYRAESLLKNKIGILKLKSHKKLFHIPFGKYKSGNDDLDNLEKVKFNNGETKVLARKNNGNV